MSLKVMLKFFLLPGFLNPHADEGRGAINVVQFLSEVL